MSIEEMGEVIRLRRIYLRISKAELSRCSGVSVSSIKSFEAGKANPSIINLSRLCMSLGLEIEVVGNEQ